MAICRNQVDKYGILWLKPETTEEFPQTQINNNGCLKDTQMTKVYNAESEAFYGKGDNWGGVKIPKSKFATTKSCQSFMRNIVTEPAFKRWYPDAYHKLSQYPIQVKAGRKNASAVGENFKTGEKNQITLPEWARKRYVMLHELSHLIQYWEYNLHSTLGRRSVAGHGWEFCAIYLKLIRRVMGADASSALRASFKKRGVKHLPQAPVNVAASEYRAAKPKEVRIF